MRGVVTGEQVAQIYNPDPFARQLAAKAWAYAVAVERRYRGLPLLPEAPVPYTLTVKAEAVLDANTERADLVPLPGGREVTA